jgi:hypothetical protein
LLYFIEAVECIVTGPNSLRPQLAIELGTYGWPRENVTFLLQKCDYLLKGDLPLKNANGRVVVCVNLELQFIHLVIIYYYYHVLLSAVLCRTHVVLWFGRVKMYYIYTRKKSTIHIPPIRSVPQPYHISRAGSKKYLVCSNHGEQNNSNRAHVYFSDSLTSGTHQSAASIHLIMFEF